MDLIDTPKSTFLPNLNNYYYNVTPFRLKSAYSTDQRLMGTIYSKQISFNLKVYIGDLIVKTSDKVHHESLYW